jgi:hypothetical protein
MQTIYTLTIRPSVQIPVGGLRLDVGNERTYLFRSLKERQAVIDWAKANGWECESSIDHLMAAKEVKAEIAQNVARCCEPFYFRAPELVDA